MINLNVSMEKNGVAVKVGTIKGTGANDACFGYDKGYLKSETATAVSVSMPLRGEPFSPEQTASFFEGLLPEGFTRRSVAQQMRADEGDYPTILHGLGRECLGALRVSEDGDDTEASYEPVTVALIRELAEEGAAKTAEIITDTHLSLAGASGKVGLYFDSEHGKWYLPRGTAPSTHIVKQSHVRLHSIVTNEQLSQMTAKRCGIDVPRSFIINTGEGEDREVLLATERFDRVFTPSLNMIDGLQRPCRLHQEDLAQALGIPSHLKYERDGGTYMKRMFDLLRRVSADPVRDQLKLWDRIVFNVLIGNTDAHVKNFALLYDPSGRSPRLSPAYDIVSTTVYAGCTKKMSFAIGGVYDLQDIATACFERAASEVGIGTRIALDRVREMCERFPDALENAAAELTDMGFPKADSIKQMILEQRSPLLR